MVQLNENLMELGNKIATSFLKRNGYIFVRDRKIYKNMNHVQFTVTVETNSVKIVYYKYVFGDKSKKTKKWKQKVYYDVDNEILFMQIEYTSDKTCREYPKDVISGWVLKRKTLKKIVNEN